MSIYEYEELPALVLDGQSLFNKMEIIPNRIKIIPELFNLFNLYLYQDTALLKRLLWAERYRRLEQIYEIDYVNRLQCSIDDLVGFLVVKKSVILTSREELAIRCGGRAWNQFDAAIIKQQYEYKVSI